MGKVEKELESTYWHARDIAAEAGGYSRVEIAHLWLIDDERVKDLSFEPSFLEKIIRARPELLAKDDFIRAQVGSSVLGVLMSDERFDEYLTPEVVDQVYDSQLANIISIRPEHVDRFSQERLNSMSIDAIRFSISRQKELYYAFKEIVNNRRD